MAIEKFFDGIRRCGENSVQCGTCIDRLSRRRQRPLVAPALMLAGFPSLSRQWLCFTACPLRIGRGTPPTRLVPLREMAGVVEAGNRADLCAG